MSLLKSLPYDEGFNSNAEFEEHFGTIMIFPERPDIWRNNAKYAQELIIKLANIIIQYENVVFCVKPSLKEKVAGKLNEKIQIFEVEYDDIWARDISPNFVVKNGILRAINWQFNSWGGLSEGAYFPWDKDNDFAINLSNFLEIDYYDVYDIVLEGGAVITDGHGTAITTESVLLNKNRNPMKSKMQIEEAIKKYYCVEKVIWLPKGLILDETGGHIDNICSFVKESEICLAYTDDKSNKNYKILQEAYKILSKERDAYDRPFLIHKFPMPSTQFITGEESSEIAQFTNSTNRIEGFELAPSYLNYYLINNGVIFPIFNCETDGTALKLIKKIFPSRKILPFESKEILIGGGGFHCIFHEIPKVVK